MSYVLDTSALVGAWVRSYPPDSFPALWDSLDKLVEAGRLTAPEEVFEELKAQDDDLYKWVKDRKDAIIVPTSRAVMLEARAILADHPRLTMPGRGRGRADPFVIALACTQGAVVVTQEQGGSADKPRIPYVCKQRAVGCAELLDVIRREGWTF